MPMGAGEPRKRQVGEVRMVQRVIPMDKLPTNIGKTSRDILKVIALHLGEDEEKRVEYSLIGASLNKSRETVRKSVNRLIEAKILRSKDGKLSIPCSILVNV